MYPSLTVVFLSHCWWERPAGGGAAGAPDYTQGERKGLKWRVACGGIDALIEQEGLDASRVAIWCDWFSIDQVLP